MKSHLVTIVLCVKDAEAYVASSVNSLLNQSYSPIEIVVIDDGSTDSTLEILRTYSDRICIHACDHRGVWAARNFGVKIAQGEFVAFQDADDISFYKRIETQIEVVHRKKDTNIVFGNMVEFSGDENEVLTRAPEDLEESKIAAICPGAMLFSKKAFYEVGEFNTLWNVAGFLDWYMRAKDMAVNIEIPETIILARRIHEANSTSLAGENLSKEYLQVIREGLARRNKMSS